MAGRFSPGERCSWAGKPVRVISCGASFAVIACVDDPRHERIPVDVDWLTKEGS